MLNTCTCGRLGEHCPNADCGSVSRTPLKQRTSIMSRQLGVDVRYYTCRKCGIEYGWLNGSLYDGECYAPKEIKLVATPQSLEREVKDLNEAIEFIRLRGGIVDFPDGIKEPGMVIAKRQEEELVIKEAPELTIRHADTGEVIKQYSKEDFESLSSLFKKKEPSKDE